MLQLINELKDIPGVIGACTYSLQFGLQENNLPKIFKPEKLTAIGKQLNKLYTAGQMNFDDLSDLILNYDETIIAARKLPNNHLFFAICEPSLNQNLLSMSLNLLQEEYHDDLMASKNEVSSINSSVENPEPSKTKNPADTNLTALFESLRDHLFKIMGPMAGLIFDEAIDKWQTQGAVVGSRLENLLDLLYQEIGDGGKIKHYQELIDPELMHYRTGK